MKLELGKRVYALDGRLGDLTDIVIDPIEHTVTHIVVESSSVHRVPRLVPISLVAYDHDRLTVQLPKKHVQFLQRVSHYEFIRLGEDVQTSDEWDVGTQDVLGMPYWSAAARAKGEFPLTHVEVMYDRIPKGQCEIRRLSEVVTSDEQTIGRVDGFVADADKLIAVVVEVLPRAKAKHRLVPMGEVSRVTNDRIHLGITEAVFRSLPDSQGFRSPDGSDVV